MASIKNEHIVWGYAEQADGKGQVLIIGITDTGLQYLKAGEGVNKRTLTIDHSFSNVTNVVIYNEKTKEALKEVLRKAGIVVSEVH